MDFSSFETEFKVDKLLQFWEESLSSHKILRKLVYKEQNLKAKLSDKEVKLKAFLMNDPKGNSLKYLAPDSTTRKYGELAVVSKDDMRKHLVSYFSSAGNATNAS